MVKFTHKITVIVTAQIILIITSFLIIVHFESQTNLAGNIVNVAGKNRVLTIMVRDELSHELLHGSGQLLRDGGTALTALDNLKENILFLKTGGSLSGVEIVPLSPRFDGDWINVWDKYVQYETIVHGFISTWEGNEGGGTAVASSISDGVDIDDVKQTGDELVALSSTLTDKLGHDVAALSSDLIMLQVSLGTVNVAVHIFMIWIIWRIFNRHADQRIMMEKFAMVGEFSSMIAHDMKNPFGTILNSVALIKNHGGDESIVAPAIAKIERSVRRISRQIDEMLNYSRDVPFEIATVSVREMVDRSLDLIVVPGNVSVTLPENDALIRCDVEKMEMVFSNLLLNAVQAMGADGGRVSVRLTEEYSDGTGVATTVLEFENSGPPIPRKDLPRIFEPLFTTKMEGTGLGLANCKNIVANQHGGSISVANDPVRFTIRIPQMEDGRSRKQ